MARTFRPQHLAQALDTLRQQPVTVIAGGTDIYPAHVGRPIGSSILDLSLVHELRGIRMVEGAGQGFIELGATVTWTDLVSRRSDLLAAAFLDCLVMAGAEVGGQQIQNRGTVAGNLVNASPAADGVPPLLALDATVVLASTSEERLVPLAEFIIGPRHTVLRSDELVRAVRIPVPAIASHSAFLKLGNRRYLVISAAMVAARLSWHDGRIASAAVAVGSCSPVARRLHELESGLVDCSASELISRCARPLADGCLQPLAPISDLRGSADYRLDAADVMVRRVLTWLAQHAGASVLTGKPPASEPA